MGFFYNIMEKVNNILIIEHSSFIPPKFFTVHSEKKANITLKSFDLGLFLPTYIAIMKYQSWNFASNRIILVHSICRDLLISHSSYELKIHNLPREPAIRVLEFRDVTDL